MPCGSCKNQCFGGTYHILVFLCSVLQLLVTANTVPSVPILVTLMMEVIHSSETPILTRPTWCNIPEVSILHSHCRENLKSYISHYCLLPYDLWYETVFQNCIQKHKSSFKGICMLVTYISCKALYCYEILFSAKSITSQHSNIKLEEI
jgi:hypothetical protein